MKIYINFKTFFLEIIIFILGLFVLINDVIPQTQYYHQLIGTNTASSLYYNINSSNLGIGTTSPSAMLHIRSTNFATQPLFQIDIVNGYSNIASVKSLYTDGTTNYGICQTSTSGGLINYFQDPVRINNMTLYKGTGNRKSQISTDPYVNQFDFIMTPCDPSCDPVTPLTVNSTGIIVRSHLVTGYFQLLTNPGVNKILVSDSAGNGNWTDPSMLSNNFWSNNFQDVHLNFPLYQKVGIGTSNPIDRFQVNDGIGKVSLGSVPDSLLSGTGYIGFNAAHHLSGWMFSGNSGNNGGGVIYSNVYGEMFFSTIGSTNGSDKILSNNDIINNIKLSIIPNGRIGMGTRTPTRSLEICHSDGEGGMVLNQISPDDTSKELNTTEIRFEKRGNEKYAIGYWKNANRPSFFIWNNMFQRTALFITEDNKVAINTEWPDPKADFYVNGNIESSAMGIGRTPPLSGSYKLYVEGGIAAREVKVTAVTFPDFVFEKNYNLLPINKLEEYISNEKHLPDLPSQSDIEKDNGVKIGELQLKLLQKIEEQSLYIISLQKQINELREELETKKEK